MNKKEGSSAVADGSSFFVTIPCAITCKMSEYSDKSGGVINNVCLKMRNRIAKTVS
jgi:hypothetical protein